MKGREEREEKSDRLALFRARGIMALIALLFIFQAGLLVHNKFIKAENLGEVKSLSQSGTSQQVKTPPGPTSKAVRKSSAKVPLQVNINTADSAELVSLYGIGAYTARRILNYRERIGSFAYVEQLLEVKGIDSARFAGIEQDVIVKEEEIRRFSLDTVSEAFMRRHPYIGAYAAQGIVIMRATGVHITPMRLYREKVISLERARKLMFYCE